jgi:V/A-type H+-transporting ATPase subunit A
MPVTAREASIYTGVTIAEYFRDQGYHVALLADSTSRWAEALREVAGRLEELPAEEGYPAYLGSRLAAFYERAGHCRTLGGAEGSVSVIGSVSPPGGDFSEPVTRNTQGLVGAFWALSKPLADSRHYPAIGWDQSFSDYAERVADWWREQARGWSGSRRLAEGAAAWPSLRGRALGLLREADELRQIASIIGPAALSERQQWAYHAAGLIKDGLLQQNALDPVDTFCTPARQVLLASMLLSVHERGKELIERGVPSRSLLRLPGLSRLKRARLEAANDRLDLLERLWQDVERELAEVARAEAGA